MDALLAVITVVVAVAIAAVVLNPHLLKNPTWRATVTPIASIIGSGFLVAGPILAHTVGNWSWLAMAGLCLMAYRFGAAIRCNIRYVEPSLGEGAPASIAILERLSHLALSLAYFISVAYYLNLFAAFGLRGFGITEQQSIRLLSSAVILAVGLFGAVRGLRGLEFLEEISVGIKLSAIGGLIAAMAISVFSDFATGSLTILALEHNTGWHEIQVLLGLVILVQGFETSRFLGSAYGPALRIKTMKYAQLFSTMIYISFILFMTPFFRGSLPAEGGETAIIDVLAPLGLVAAPTVILAAVCSQLSAAVADTNGASGLLNDATAQWISIRLGNVITASAAMAITWSANIFEIIAYASKAFVLYYLIQSIIAAIAAYSLMAPRN